MTSQNLLTTPWHNTFADLGTAFSTPVQAAGLPAPYWVGRNAALAQALDLDIGEEQGDGTLNLLSGNTVAPGSRPLASVYSGHQFGQWAGQLGDGRALLLGDVDTALGRQEMQLKGAGKTPYSRGGDGRAVLRSSIREYLCSEAMYGLGVPTTRALCVTGSDLPVRREEVETAAVVTRLAPSFIRFGHFEHFSYRQQYAELRTLADQVIDQHYPECRTAERTVTHFQGNVYAALLEAVSERTAQMVARWQAVGFCHGVMNTDNMSILGLTLDYGPFQFLDAFDPGHVCNHSDNQGRYAYNKQPNIAYWNLFCLGQALLPLINEGAGDEQELALAALESYKTVFPAALETQLRAKLGLSDLPDAHRADARALAEDLLKRLAAGRVDYTIFWRRLSHYVAALSMPLAVDAARAHRVAVRDLFIDREGFDAWLLQYSELITPTIDAETGVNMLKVNPKFVLRNHLGELAIRAAKAKDYTVTDALLTVLQSPFDEHPAHEAFAGFPPDWATGIEISCSS